GISVLHRDVLAVGLSIAERSRKVAHETERQREIIAAGKSQLVIGYGTAGQAYLGTDLLQAAAGWLEILVQGVVGIRQRQRGAVNGVMPDLVNLVEEHLRRVAGDQVQLGLVDADTDVDAVRFADREAQVRRKRVGVGQVRRDVLLALVQLQHAGVVADADAAVGEIGIEERHLVLLEEEA